MTNKITLTIDIHNWEVAGAIYSLLRENKKGLTYIRLNSNPENIKKYYRLTIERIIPSKLNKSMDIYERNLITWFLRISAEYRKELKKSSIHIKKEIITNKTIFIS